MKCALPVYVMMKIDQSVYQFHGGEKRGSLPVIKSRHRLNCGEIARLNGKKVDGAASRFGGAQGQKPEEAFKGIIPWHSGTSNPSTH